MAFPGLATLFATDTEKGRYNRDLAFVNLNLTGFALFGIGVASAVWWGRISVALLWASASAAAGFITGFLFGFPRTIAQPESQAASPPAGSTPAAAPSPSRASRLSVNTNLEQVSDWITKTIVGVGLVELKLLPRRFVDLATYASQSIGKPVTGSAAAPAAAALIGYFAVLGFLGGYLITRMFFQTAFGRADNGLEEAAQALRGAPPPPPIGGSPASAPTQGVADAAQRIKDVPLAQMAAQGLDSTVVARANLYAGNADKAVAAYMDAISKDPRNPRLRLEYASALRAAKRDANEVIAALLNACAVELDKPSAELRRNIFESLTYMCLYEPPPRGFTNAISYGEQYVQDKGNQPSDIIWVNLASAYGQQARWFQQQKQDFSSVRQKALDAVKQAIQLEASNKSFLAKLLDPTSEDAANGEDDLAVFRQDPEFRELLGLPALT